jgi:dipeptidyl aminopeptidase/acylaminoacyl peptidase
MSRTTTQSRVLVASLFVAVAGVSSAATFTATEMMKLRRLATPQVSPDGKLVAYAQTDVDLAAGTRNSDVWLVPAGGGEPRRVSGHPKSDTEPRFSPDGKRLAFLSTREGSAQVFALDLPGGEVLKVTALVTDVESFQWLDNQTLLVASRVYPDCATSECNKKRLDSAGKPDSGQAYDELLFRHWDTWDDGRRSHLFVVPLDGRPERDLTPGPHDVPPWSLGGPGDVAVSPDGHEVCFSRNDDRVAATSTNADLFVLPVAGGTAKKIAATPGYDGGCRYSPDGTRIAYRAQLRPGYEADRWRVMVYDRKTGATTSLTEAFDRHAESVSWSADSKTIYFPAEDNGASPIFAVPAAGGPVRKIADGSFSDVQAATGGTLLVASRSSLTYPAEIVRVPLTGPAVASAAVASAPVVAERITKVNDAFLDGFGLRPGESVSYTGAAGKKVQAFVVKPPSFDPAKTYPLLVFIHGGPQGAWNDAWSNRWNPQVFASAGYVVLMPNPRGSIGWGQEFEDDINGDWGGRAYEDVMKGTDWAEALPYIAKGRTSAAGASYGGYLINWIAGHTDRYRALVSHDGVFNLSSMYGSTEELWFVEWEFKGTPWETPETYAKWSPHLFVKEFKTPTLVIHSSLDYRVPIEQGLAMFTSLKRRGVPSRFLTFPDENHWVLKPANSVRWYAEVQSWLDRYTR